MTKAVAYINPKEWDNNENKELSRFSKDRKVRIEAEPGMKRQNAQYALKKQNAQCTYIQYYTVNSKYVQEFPFITQKFDAWSEHTGLDNMQPENPLLLRKLKKKKYSSSHLRCLVIANKNSNKHTAYIMCYHCFEHFTYVNSFNLHHYNSIIPIRDCGTNILNNMPSQ